jgi:hypothetical protein
MRQWALIAIGNSSKSKANSQRQRKLLIALIYQLHVAIVLAPLAWFIWG